MVRKFISFVYGETNSLNQAAFLLGLFSILSQFIGFLRDRLLAHIFGVGIDLDIYYSAFRIPDFLFITVASLVSLSVLIPFIIEKDGQGREQLRKFIDSIFVFFSILMIGSAVVTYFLIPQISEALFKSLPEGAVLDIIFISRVLLLSPIILGLSNLLGSLTQAYNRFIVYAIAPILYNAGIVVGIILFSENWGVLGVVFGVLAGALMHLLVQVPFVLSHGLSPRFTFKPDWKSIKMVAKISVPRTLTLSMSALIFIFLVSLASRMTEGSVSVLSFSWNLQSISLTLIGISYSLAAFPTLTRKFQEKNIKEFLEQMQITSRFIIFWSLPLVALLVVLRAQIVRVMLGSGAFDWTATRLTAAALALFVISSVFQSLILLFMRGFYSAGVTKKPFFINFVSAILMVFGTYKLVELFYSSHTFHYFISALMKVEDLPSGVVLMLPLGFTLGTILNGILLWVVFELDFPGYTRGVLRALFEGVGAAFIMGAITYVGLNIFAHIFVGDTLTSIFLQGFLSGLLGIVAAVIILVALKSPELTSVWDVLKDKFWKTKVIATDPEIV